MSILSAEEKFKNLQGQTSPFPFLIDVDYAKGSYIYDKNGKAYLDMIAGVAVNNIGHNHPEVVQALKTQIDRHLHVMVYGEFIQDAPLEMAERLVEMLPEQLNSVYAVNSGTEANEAAIKLAKRITGRREIISCFGAYHGSTNGSLSLSSNAVKKNPFEPLLPEVNHIRHNSIEDLSKITEQTAGVFIETIQGDAGVRQASTNYLKALKARCEETGAQLIYDEVQCGLGRSGLNFAFEHSGVVPDILTLGKALGGGMPIGALVSHKEKMDLFSHDPILGHITTFGGHPVVCAAAAAGLKVLSEIDYQQIELIGQQIEDELLKLEEVKAIRRVGYMFAFDMESPELVNQIVTGCLEKGLLSFWFLSHPDSFRLSPPLTLSKEEADIAIAIVKEVIIGIRQLK
ncbi:aspartate aminotransferase family protein [Brumimicrobium aurantiacum]|uniref:Aspartate aminotransferase family protein n=1 Tax=Brumimicrobium aurantiacum TaxID=1737063 RepID=A0A3E1EUK0_9FLAO|nr:aspartate aminotransferase family protein [Brumimicrobium aurantiacum]RFC53208.1 aspartate aminotransferase family protein [Brumimicrobium aurantiacum]